MIKILFLVLFVLLLAVGGERGAISIMALGGNIIVLSLTVFLLASGFPPMIAMLLAGTAISYITLVKQNGKNGKTKSAFVATGIVMFFLGFVVWIIVYNAGAGGLNEIQVQQEDIMFYYNVNIHIKMLQVAVCINLLSVLGAVLDTTLSITSSMYEVMLHTQEITKKELFFSGIQIGKGITGTTINTLLFAYLGESMLLFAYIANMGYSCETVINSKFLFQGLSIMLTGGIACLIAVPVSSAIAVYIFVTSVDKEHMVGQGYQGNGEK